MDPIRIALLTVSDGVASGTREDRSGDAIVVWVESRGYTLAERAVVDDHAARISARLADWADAGIADVALTTGGTGFTARDVTPEATRSVIDREAPGVAEALRQRGAQNTPFAWLSRGVAGTRARTLIVNLPGGTGGTRDGLDVLETLLEHAVQLLRGVNTERHDRDHG
jgi:molybdopterin adenylyltransferase